MASQAWKDLMNPQSKPVSRQQIIDDIYRSTQAYNSALANRTNAGSTRSWDQANAFGSEAIREQERQTQLKYLLNAGAQSGGWGEGSGGGSGGGNPFGVGGSGSGGAPTMDTSNRFEAGLSDAETRLRGLLDNPDSINQSAAYKFRVKQGEEAINRQLGARGMLNSGNRLMELTKYGQDMGSQEYDNQFGRIKDLVGGYSSSWLGDKNANTARYAAESNAWNNRGGLLKDLVGQANTSANQNQQVAGDARNAWANTWVSANNKPQQYVDIKQPFSYATWKG